MTDFRNGHWHYWSGRDECPVNHDDIVVVYMRNGQFLGGRAGNFEWKHNKGKEVADSDIIRFSVFERAPGPKYLWAIKSVLGDIDGHYATKGMAEAARACADMTCPAFAPHTIHRYVEAPE